MKFFYDSYALIEYLSGNERYKKYFEDAEGMLTSMNLIEVHYHLLALFSERDADEAIKAFCIYSAEPRIDELIDASKFRKSNKKKNLSYTDCVGYVVAKSRGVRFLTGDKEFHDLPNVEFVK